MAEKQDFGMLMAQHGEKIAVIMAAVAVLAFGFLALTSGTPPMPLDRFTRDVDTARQALDRSTGERVEQRDVAGAITKWIEPAEPFPKSALGLEATRVPMVVDANLPAIGEVHPPAHSLEVVTAQHGKARIRWKPTRHDMCMSYGVKWWVEGESEPDWSAQGQSTSVTQRRDADWVDHTIEGLTDNTRYIVKVRSFGRGGPLDFRGANPSEEGPGGNGLQIYVVSKGDTKGIPEPTGAEVVSQSLEGVTLTWTSAMDAINASEKDFVEAGNIRVLIWRQFGDDRATRTLLTQIDGDHPLGWTLEQAGTTFTDRDLRPDVEIHYWIQYFQVEAFSDGRGGARTPQDREIRDKSFSGIELSIELAQLRRTGDPDVEVTTAGTVIKARKRYTVFASREVRFRTDAVGGKVFLPNQPIIRCINVTQEPRVPNLEGGAGGRVEVTKYCYVEDPTSKQPVWRPFSVEFNVRVGATIGSVTRPQRMAGEALDRTWRDVRELDPVTGLPIAGQDAGQLNFTTPFRVVGMYQIDYGPNFKLFYAELQNTTRSDTKPFKVYRERDLGQPWMETAPRGLSAGPTSAEWLARYRAYHTEVVYRIERQIAQSKGRFDRRTMQADVEAARFGLDARTPTPLLEFSIKYGVRFYTPTQLNQPNAGQIPNLNEINDFIAECERTLINEWNNIKRNLSADRRQMEPAVRDFVLKPGHDTIAMPDLFAVVQRTPNAAGSLEIYKVILEILKNRMMPDESAGQSAVNSLIANLDVNDVGQVAGKLSNLRGELERYYDLNPRR